MYKRISFYCCEERARCIARFSSVRSRSSHWAQLACYFVLFCVALPSCPTYCYSVELLCSMSANSCHIVHVIVGVWTMIRTWLLIEKFWKFISDDWCWIFNKRSYLKTLCLTISLPWSLLPIWWVFYNSYKYCVVKSSFREPVVCWIHPFIVSSRSSLCILGYICISLTTTVILFGPEVSLLSYIQHFWVDLSLKKQKQIPDIMPA